MYTCEMTHSYEGHHPFTWCWAYQVIKKNTSWYTMRKYSSPSMVQPFFQNFDSKMVVVTSWLCLPRPTALPSFSFWNNCSGSELALQARVPMCLRSLHKSTSRYTQHACDIRGDHYISIVVVEHVLNCIFF